MAENTPVELAAVFASMARKLLQQPSMEQTLEQVVELAASTVDTADYAGVTVLRRNNTFESLAYTDELVTAVDRAQERLGEGPCLETITDEPILLITDTEQEQRWPRFAAAVRELGIRSILACQLVGERGSIGSLNLHARQPDAFDDGAIHMAAIYSAHAAVAMSHARLVDSLNTAISSRQSIGEATGILMERYKVTSPQAFEMLVHASQNTNIKLRDVAARVVETGTSPGDLRTSPSSGSAPGGN